MNGFWFCLNDKFAASFRKPVLQKMILEFAIFVNFYIPSPIDFPTDEIDLDVLSKTLFASRFDSVSNNS